MRTQETYVAFNVPEEMSIIVAKFITIHARDYKERDYMELIYKYKLSTVVRKLSELNPDSYEDKYNIINYKKVKLQEVCNKYMYKGKRIFCNMESSICPDHSINCCVFCYDRHDRCSHLPDCKLLISLESKKR